MTTTISWRKHALEDDRTLEKLETKRPKFYYYYILDSESSPNTDDDTESVYSLQDKTTDTVRDTTDTDTKTENEFEVEIEYEVASLASDSDQDTISVTSSEPEDIMLAAAAICDSSLETFVTDAEDSDNSQQEDSTGNSLLDFFKCIRCNSNNNNRQLRYCDKCYQDRKTTFPVRPRRYKKAKKNDNLTSSSSSTTTTATRTSSSSPSSSPPPPRSTSPVKLDALKSCLSSLSQDSGLGSSQELPKLCLDEIYVPSTSSSQEQELKENDDFFNINNRKRQFSESSLSEFEISQFPKKLRNSTLSEQQKKQDDFVNNNSNVNITKTDNVNLNECKELCIICHNAPKNSIFLHGRIAHMCCCYKCSMRTWKYSKRCPICNRRVNNVVRVFTT